MPPTVLVSKPAKRATPWSSWTMKSPVRRSVKLRSRPRPRRGPAPVDQPVLGDRGELKAGSDEAVAQVGLLEDEALLGALPARLDAHEVVGGALAATAVRPGDERRVARAHELLELRLGLVQRARGELGRLGTELERLGAGDRGQPQRPAPLERGEDAVRADVE